MGNLFTYGSLMYGRVWKAVVGSAHIREAAVLEGYLRRRIRTDVYPVIYPGTGSVEGILYRDVSNSELGRLDRFEGEYYRRSAVTVRCADGSESPAFAYVLKKEFYPLIGGAWDPESFERSGIRRFLNNYRGFEESGD